MCFRGGCGGARTAGCSRSRAFTHKNLEWLDDPAFNWDMGFNYLIDGHRAKITLQYSLRPSVHRAELWRVRRSAWRTALRASSFSRHRLAYKPSRRAPGERTISMVVRHPESI